MSVAQAYERRGVLLIVPMKEMQNGGYIEFGRIRQIDLSATFDAIGKVLEEELDEAESSAVPVATESLQETPTVQRAVGAKNWKDFFIGTKSCWVEREGSTIRLTPMPAAKQRSYTFDPSRARVLLEPTRTQIGSEVIAVLAALAPAP